jgi:cell division protein FtsQ
MTKKIPIIVKIFGFVCLFLMAAAYFAGSTVIVQKKMDEMSCTDIHIQIVDSTVSRLVLQHDIYDFLNKNKISLIGKKIKDIDLYQLEQLMKQEKGIENCEVFTRLNGVVTFRIAQRIPLLRLETSRGSYYLDDSGALFPTIPQRTAYVPVVSGNVPIEHAAWMAQLYEFGLYIRNNRFWNAQIEQLYVHNMRNIEVVSRTGAQTTILLGDLDRFEYKLQKLYTFYCTVAVTHGWDRYDRIDLRFNNQIVCRTP